MVKANRSALLLLLAGLAIPLEATERCVDRATRELESIVTAQADVLAVPDDTTTAMLLMDASSTAVALAANIEDLFYFSNKLEPAHQATGRRRLQSRLALISKLLEKEGRKVRRVIARPSTQELKDAGQLLLTAMESARSLADSCAP